MISQGEDLEAHALRRQGWSISAIARHLDRDRKTNRASLNGQREPGKRKPAVEADPFDTFEAYVRQRFVDDPHAWSITVFDEVTAAGYVGAYPTFTRQSRTRSLRPPCEACAPARGRAAAVIPHPPAVETQWDWVEFPDPPEYWEWGKTAHGLLGTLARSGRLRGRLSPSMDQAHLIEGLDDVCRRLGGVTQRWWFDRMATVVSPGSGKGTASFVPVAKHYGVGIDICPPRRGNCKGVVEKAIHGAPKRWWRTLPDDVTPE